MDMFTSYGYIKKRKKNTDFFMILDWLCRFKLCVGSLSSERKFVAPR